MRVLGIDPGKDGAVVLVEDGAVVAAIRAASPLGYVYKLSGGKREYSEKSMRDIVEGLLPFDLAVLEKQSFRPGEGGVGAFSCGLGYGLWRGILAALKAPYEVVDPKKWTKAVTSGEKGETKERAVRVAERRFPGLDLRPGKSVNPHSGLADAACLCVYGGTMLPGGGKEK